MDVDAITDFIDQASVAIKYWKAMGCPCATQGTGQPNVNCFQCRGLGWLYQEAESGELFQRAVVHNRRSQRANHDGGFVSTGYASITFRQGITPGDGDLVMACADREVVNDERHVLGGKLSDGSPAETLRFRDVICVERVVVFDPQTTTSMAAPDGSWAFDPASRTVQFDSGLGLTPGTRYSLRYQARPEYVLLGHTSKPLLRVSHDDNLPEPARTRKDVQLPMNCQAVRLDRAIVQRLRGAGDLSAPATTFNNKQGRGPFL